MSKKVQLLMFLDPQIDCDMSRIGIRVSRMEQCNLCKGCYNRRRCIHLERWKRVKRERERIIAKSKKHHLRGGVCGDCKPGYTDIGLICSKPAWIESWCVSDGRDAFGDCFPIWDTRLQGHPDESYGKCNDEIRGFFEQVSDKLKEVFGPNGPLAQIFDPHLNGVAAAFEQLGETLSNALDPEKNGVAAAFRKFGDDVESAFHEIGDKIKGFFDMIGNSIVDGMRKFGEMLSKFGDDLKDFFSDPQNIIGLIATILSGIGSCLPPPLSNLMGVLSACTTIIGNAAIGAPFDPSSLVDLASSFILPPEEQLAKNIASDVEKAATITDKIATRITSTATHSLEAVNTAAKNFGKLSAADKAYQIGKATAKVGGKAAMYVGKQSVSGLGPIGATQSAEDQASDDALGDQLNTEQADPQRDVNSDAMNAQLAQDDFDKNLWTTEFGGTEAGELASKDQKQRDSLKKQYTAPVASVTSQQAYELATGDPASFTDDEKYYWYGEVTDEKRADARSAAASYTQSIQSQMVSQKVADAQVALDKATTPQDRYNATLALQDAQVESTSQADKDAQELKKFGLTYAQAKSMLKQYQDEIDKFSGKSGAGRRKRRGGDTAAPVAQGTDYTQSVVPTPDYFPEDKVDRGEELGYGVGFLPPIVTPTFFHFATKFPDVPPLKNPDNWFNEYNQFHKAYDKLKTDYNALVETNEEAINARNSLPLSSHDKSYQDFLAQAEEQRDPINLAPSIKAKGANDYLNFIENLGYTPHTWNEFMTELDRPDLSIEEPNENDLHPDTTSPEIIPPLSQEFHVPDGEEFEKKLGKEKPPSPWAGKKTGGAVLVQPTKEAILSYYRKLMGKDDPTKVFTEDDLMKRFEIDWHTKPAVIASAIRSNSIQHNQTIKTGGRRRRSFSEFFGLKGGADDTAPTLTTDAQNNATLADLRKKNADAASKMAMTLWTEQLPEALKAYLAAQPKDKLIQRQTIRALIAYGDLAYGPLEFTDESDPVYAPRQSFEDDVSTRAPEIYDAGDSKTPDEVAAEKKATTGTTPLMAGSGAKSGLEVPPTLVMENLWLGNRDDATNEEWLRKHHIHAVFNCTKDVEFAPGVKQYRFPINDDEAEVDTMTHEAPKFVKRILKEMERGPVLVHCIEGRQRSPAVVALTMWIKKQGTGGAIRRELKKLRPIAFTPRATFEKSLQRWMN